MLWTKRTTFGFISLLFAAMLVVAACNDTKATPKPAGDTMIKEGDTMSKDCGAPMVKADETMAKDATAMPKTGDTMVKDGDTMAKDCGDAMMVKVPNKITAPHFVDSAPNHGDVLPQAPNAITLNFNFNLHKDSTITVTRDGAPVTVGATSVSANELTLSAPITGGTGNGTYTVNYKACWPDRSCHEGSVSFVVDSAQKQSFIDMQKKAAAISLKDIAFSPARIIVTAGTKVTWTNNDAVAHFVNTDPHPSHNGLPSLNSTTLGANQSYSYTFATPGIYGYHCSVHTGMSGQVLVMP